MFQLILQFHYYPSTKTKQKHYKKVKPKTSNPSNKKDLNRILTNQSQQYIKRIMQHNQGGLPWENKTGAIFKNQYNLLY